MMGRAPTADDLIVPNAPTLLHSTGKVLPPERCDAERERVRALKPNDVRHCRMPQLGLKRAREDCAKLGLRGRRNHDARRTMISIARAGGASKDLLEWITHGPPGDVIDGYTTLPWETLCEQVLCIKVERREGKVIALPVAVAAGGGPTETAIGESRSQVRSQVLLSARAEERNGVGRTGFGNVGELAATCGLFAWRPDHRRRWRVAGAFACGSLRHVSVDLCAEKHRRGRRPDDARTCLRQLDRAA